jgi:hypothetical protein
LHGVAVLGSLVVESDLPTESSHRVGALAEPLPKTVAQRSVLVFAKEFSEL